MGCKSSVGVPGAATNDRGVRGCLRGLWQSPLETACHTAL